MISYPAYSSLNHAFLQYLNALPVKDEETKKHFDIKKTHTYRVVQNIRLIAERSGFSKSEIQLAEIIALFHDIGRFEQFIIYRTFDDSISENHAGMALRVLDKQHLLSDFDDTVKKIIIRSIENHNIPILPEIPDTAVSLFSRLLRDADKLDIWRITLEQNVVYTILKGSIPDNYSVPEIILDRIRKRRVVLLHYAESLNDFRLLRLSWIVDINFPAAYAIIEEKGYIDKIISKIPDFPEKDEIAAILHSHCRKKYHSSKDNVAGR